MSSSVNLAEIAQRQLDLQRTMETLLSAVQGLSTQLTDVQRAQSEQLNNLRETVLVHDVVLRQEQLEGRAATLVQQTLSLQKVMTDWNQSVTQDIMRHYQGGHPQDAPQIKKGVVPAPIPKTYEQPKAHPPPPVVSPTSFAKPATAHIPIQIEPLPESPLPSPPPELVTDVSHITFKVQKSQQPLDTPQQSMMRLHGTLGDEAAANPFWTEDHSQSFQKHFLSTAKQVVMFGAPISEGQGLTGVDAMARCMREGGLQRVVENVGWRLEDMGDLPLKEVIAQVQRSGEAQKYPEPKIHNCFEVGKALERVYDACYQAARRGAFVLCVGGDHSVASGSIAGVLKARKELCVVWVDAHGDCNTPETSPSGNYHGMPAAHVLGWFRRRVPGFDWLKMYVPEHRFCFIALRDIDASEAQLMRSSGIVVFSMHDVDRWGIGRVMEMALHRINPHNDRPIHLSFDIDAVDPMYAPGTGTKAKGGLTYREARYICEHLARTNLLGSMDIVEVNTDLDQVVTEKLHGDDPTITTEFMTVQLAIELVGYAVGKKLI